MLWGALIGAVVGAAMEAVAQKLRGEEIDWKEVGKAALVGAVSGLLCGAVAGRLLQTGAQAARPTIARRVGAGVLGGALGGGAGRVTDNALDGRSLMDGVPQSTALGAVIGGAAVPVEAGVRRGVAAVADRLRTPQPASRGIVQVLEGSDAAPPARPFEGPRPTRAPMASRAEHAAALARVREGTASADEVEVVLQRAVVDVRNVLFKSVPDSDPLEGACGRATSLLWRRLQGLEPGLSVRTHQAAIVFDHHASRVAPYSHGFAVVEGGGRRWLVDLSARQFFDPASAEAPTLLAIPGMMIRSSPAGNRFADELLERGYVELTDDVVELYGHALSVGRGTGFGANDLLRPSTFDPLDHYDGDELGRALASVGADP